MLPTTPTQNPIYNDLLVRWAKTTGREQKPQCEACDSDLTGKAVFERSAAAGYGGCWLCAECLGDEILEEDDEDWEDEDDEGHCPDEDARQERRQMGITW